MKKIIIVFLLIPFYLLGQQQNYFDSVKAVLRNSSSDSGRFMNLYWLSFAYAENNPDSAIHYAQEAVQFASRNKGKLPLWTAWNGSNALGWALWSAGNYPDAQEYYFKQLAQSESIKDTRTKLERSIASKRAIKKGETISIDDIHLLSPGDGILWKDKDKIIGKVAIEDIPRDEIIYSNLVK